MNRVLYFRKMQLPVIDLLHFKLRPWHPDDAMALVKHANNPRVASNLRDGFPYPYTLSDAKKWLKMVRHAFTKTSWLRLFACIYENNPSSMRVLEKNGFKPEAIHRKAVMKEGKLMDEHLYALLKDQWKTSLSS